MPALTAEALRAALDAYVDPLIGGGTRDVVASVIIVITLMIRPYGLFGHEQIERV